MVPGVVGRALASYPPTMSNDALLVASTSYTATQHAVAQAINACQRLEARVAQNLSV